MKIYYEIIVYIYILTYLLTYLFTYLLTFSPITQKPLGNQCSPFYLTSSHRDRGLSAIVGLRPS